MLEVENLQVGYGDLTALHQVSLKVQSGAVTALVGPNGAGKTTLLKTIAGLLAPRAGVIRWQGQAIGGAAPDRIVQQGIALVPEGRRLFAQMTVRENLDLGAFSDRARENHSAQLDHVFKIFPLLCERQSQTAGLLSGGEQQMLALGRGLMGRPQLLLLDEPSIGLAPKIVESIYSILAGLNRDGMSLFIVEQNVQLALRLSQYAYILEGGRIAGAGASLTLLRDDHVRTAYLGPLARGTAR